MFLSGLLLLIPMILANEKEVKPSTHVVKFMSDFPHIAESIEVIGDPREVLDLSHHSIVDLTNNVFKNVCHIKMLNLSYNSLPGLRYTTFASLTKLEYLDVSHNNIHKLIKPFAHLSNLKLLDLSNNDMHNLMTSDFFGLTESCVILLKGNEISFMSAELFENKSYSIIPIYNQRHKREVSLPFGSSIKICLDNTKLISVEHYTEGEKLPSGCSIDKYRADGFLRLNSSHIAGFNKRWYKLGNSPIHHIDLSRNHITHLTSKMFNDLPESIHIVDLSHNDIVRLREGIIVNEHLRELNFWRNPIVEIEDDVFIDTNLTTLSFAGTKLKNTKFVATLPPTLKKITLWTNGIAEISPGSFSKLNKLESLWIMYNDIPVIHKDSLRGMTGLEVLRLIDNRIQTIKAGSFKDLTNLTDLQMDYNKINKLDLGVFADLKNIKIMMLDHNELWELTRDTSINFPDSLEILDLQYNKLRTLKAGTFLNSPTTSLKLNHNYINNIENGSFVLPHLQYIELQHNLLSVIDSGMLQGLKTLQYLDLSTNKITRIEEGAFGNLRSLCKLSLSHNPIKELKKGALHGFLQKEGCGIDLRGVPIEMIHGGVFARSFDYSFPQIGLKMV